MNKNGQVTNSLRILVVAPEANKAEKLVAILSRLGFECLYGEHTVDFRQALVRPGIEIAVVDMDGSLAYGLVESVWQQVKQMKSSHEFPVIAIISVDMLERVVSFDDIDDFVIEPWSISELNTRIRRIVGRRDDESKVTGKNELITISDLQIDTASCEVSLCGKKLDLTFKEYELLKFLARNKGRVFTREALLNEVWRYDYYGGDRTVDVHIRRLRSKIEDFDHTFIETIRQIGYRFRSDN